MALEKWGEKPVSEGQKDGGNIAFQSDCNMLQCFFVRPHIWLFLHP